MSDLDESFLQFIPNGSLLIESFEEVEVREDQTILVIGIAEDFEHLAIYINDLVLISGKKDITTQLFYGGSIDDLELVFNQIPDSITLDMFSQEDNVFKLEFRKSVESDRSSNDFLVGLFEGRQSLNTGSAESYLSRLESLEEQLNESRNKCLSLLEYFSEYGSFSISETEDTSHDDLKTRDIAGTGLTEKQIQILLEQDEEKKELVNRLTLLQSRFDALQRKYDSLAASKLGSLTLRMWERKRKNEKLR
ncbi:hypothetical protein [Boudabousia liubingyangii]|uniref:hypothetical protein n=1 Tax=Boudabousia liubingyangii TaxID=1921764 RepID=UPI00117849EE|nr:hypothetical protein [Boudabousia liubingyangii]